MPYRIVVSAIVLCALFALPFVRSGATGATVDATATPKPLTCSLSGPCAETNNSSSGSGYEGISTSGAGIKAVSTRGQGLYATSASGSFVHPGVDGESLNEGGNDAGALFGGKALTDNKGPGTGVIAYGQFDGVLGRTTLSGASGKTGYGVEGDDPVSQASVNGGNDYNAGVFGETTVGSAVLAEANSAPSTNFLGKAPIAVFATAATNNTTPNPYAFAFLGETNSFGLDVHNDTSGNVVYALSPSEFFEGTGPKGSFSVDNEGNEILSGTLTTSKAMYVRPATRSGAAMMEYSSRTTAPQVEDVGKAQLEGGRAYVTIDARLADAIDRRTEYYVFVTPEGDCNGLYVTQKTPNGFAVRELRGGRSSLSFEYRIVAKPLGEDGVRLAAAPPLHKLDSDGFIAGRGATRTLPAPVSPEERLRRTIGGAAYAQSLATLRTR